MQKATQRTIHAFIRFEIEEHVKTCILICGVDGLKLSKQVQLHKIEFNLCKKERFFVKVIDVFNSHTVEKAGKLKI